MDDNDSRNESLSLSLTDLSLDTFSFDSPSSNGSSTTTPLEQSSMLATTETKDPFFSESIWARHSPTYRRVSVGDSWEYLQYMPWNVSVKGYDTNLQEKSMRMNSGSGAQYMSIWANQDYPLGHNLARPSDGGRGYVMAGSNGSNLYNGVSSQGYVATHQESLSSSEISGINDFLALEDDAIILVCKDQCGSMNLQKLLSRNYCRSKIANKILSAAGRYPFNLMTDHYGYHLFIKLIELADENQLGQITTKITSQDELFFKASVSKFGSFSMKRLIKLIAGLPVISLVICALQRRFKDTMINSNGSNVVIHCLQTLSDVQNELLYVAAINRFRELATNPVGCISLNKFINDMRGPHRGQLLELISSHAAFLSKDPSGNFVVQHVLELSDPVLTERICSLLRGKYVELSSLRYGSHVIEKCLKSPGMAHYAVEDFLKSSSQLLHLAKHKYGNYVIQTALKVTKTENISLHKRLLKELQYHRDLQFGFGKKIYNLIAAGVPVG